MVEKNEQDIRDLQARLSQADRDYNALKMAKMLTITDGDLDSAQGPCAEAHQGCQQVHRNP